MVIKYKNQISGVLKNIRLFSLCAVCLFAFSISGNAQSVLVNYDFNDAVAATPCNGGTSNAYTGVTPVFTTSTGACTTPAGAPTTGTAFVQNTTGGNAVSINGFAAGNTQYFQFQLSGVGVFQSYQVYLQALRSNTGPSTGAFQYSIDGVNFTTFQSVNILTATPLAVNIDLSSVTAINNQPNVYFRLLGSGGTATGGTFRIDNFQVQALSPTAAGANISGRATTANGRGIQNAVIMLTGNSLREPVYVRTTTFGYYNFSNIRAGETYVVSATAKQYNFTNPSRIISLNGNFADADFTATK